MFDFTGIDWNKIWKYGLFYEFYFNKAQETAVSVSADDAGLRPIEIDVVYMPKNEGQNTQKSKLGKSFYNAKIENNV
ncbi:hypothetical protein [Ephemeroptericola cinctiostellae]|uniref:hypothetical protein n=1 Tax=Ephemeroptericola cinctiostellae TaxID=2268024 RepID=UPI000DF85251|nr:hypothetical protein [Ephemeroptericola cinctiostellae]